MQSVWIFVLNFCTLKNKYDLTLCQSHLHTASETFVRHKKNGPGLIFCVFTSVASILIGKDDKCEKCIRKFQTQCARTLSHTGGHLFTASCWVEFFISSSCFSRRLHSARASICPFFNDSASRRIRYRSAMLLSRALEESRSSAFSIFACWWVACNCSSFCLSCSLRALLSPENKK